MTALDKIARENREHVMKLIDYRTEAVAHRDKAGHSEIGRTRDGILESLC
jgi:hypothetical protein